MWVPDEPCGQASYDLSLQRENILAQSGAPMTVIRPVLFMDNMLTNWVKPKLIKNSLYQYPHSPDMAANRICLDDVAKFMIAVLERDDLIGERIVVGGPDALKPEQVAVVLSSAIGKQITFDYISPRQFGERMYDVFADVSSLDRESYAAHLDSFYSYVNETNGQSFRVDMRPVLERIPIELTSFDEWAKAQDWTQGVGGPSGG